MRGSIARVHTREEAGEIGTLGEREGESRRGSFASPMGNSAASNPP